MTRRRRRLLSLLLAAAAALATAPRAAAEPFLLLMSARPKCVQVQATQDSAVIVEYNAPDMIVLDEVEQAQKLPDPEKPGGGKEDDADKDVPPGSGRDHMWYQRNKQQLEMMKRNMGRSSDFTLILSEKDDTVQERRARYGRGQTGELARVQEEPKTKTGEVRIDTTRDGIVEICAQSLTASHANPSLVSLRVKEDQQKKMEAEVEKKAEQHLNIVEGTTKAMIRKVDAILRTADYSKEQEYEFHQQSLAMNRASHYWPMIHVAILFITGVTFSHHMVQFFKTHHI